MAETNANWPAEFHERGLVTSFVVPQKRKRLLYLLHNEKRRSVALKSLAHFRDLDLRWAFLIPRQSHRLEDIEKSLLARGAPAKCYIVSEDTNLDGSFLLLNEALVQVVGGGFGTFISCIPGKLAYFEGEDLGDRYLLVRASPKESA